MSVPINKLGEEIGFTTVFYYSKHTPERREEWRHQWKKRADLDINSAKRYQSDREYIENRRNEERKHRLEYNDHLIQKEKLELQLHKEKMERKEAKKKIYEKEKQRWDAPEEKDKVGEALRWTSASAEMRKQRREQRKQQLQNFQNEIHQSEQKEIDNNPRHYLYLSHH
eukprot:TRINITY_DN26881_c0_g1_i1.p1 TRINITY_DN26881_c0_g1~~TRINITY_DN26881_c0_g1_i1.p1  ORF type:complete len:169 (-),score=49.85 TRINITY_DN26881_c0_g1_i1:125-631(-)